MDFKLYDALPSGVIVFEKEKVKFINQYILDLLNISFLSIKNSVEIILETMHLKNEVDLFHFFTNHNYFIHNDRIIQIEQNSYENLEIYSFTLINPSLLENKQYDTIKSFKQLSIDKKVAQYFKLKNIKSVEVLTFYKGLPLKNIGNIFRINDATLEIIVDTKHILSLQKRDDIVLILNKRGKFIALHGFIIEHNKNIFTINNFSLVKENMHLRENIRIKPEDDMRITIVSQKFDVYDISENGISIKIKSKEDDRLLKRMESLTLSHNDDTIYINVKYLKTVYFNQEILKVIFLMFNSSETATKIKKYLMNRQNEIINEINLFEKKAKN